MACGHQFRSGGKLSADRIWNEYQSSKQTVAEIAASHGISESTVKRRLSSVRLEWVQPPLDGGGCVHLDVTYWGRNWGVMLAVDDAPSVRVHRGRIPRMVAPQQSQAPFPAVRQSYMFEQHL